MNYPLSVVRCHGLTKTFGIGLSATRALRGLDLEVRSGELLMVMGPSGCGKTTLLSIVAALLDPDAGTCEILGHDLGKISALERARFRRAMIGFVFQRFNLLPGLSILDNVTVPLLIDGQSRKSAESRALEALDQMGLRERASALPSEMSGGQQQRVAIARALVHQPKIVVCDEPTSALDQTTGQVVMETLSAHARQADCTVIVVTHDTRILRYADRVAQMDDGVVVTCDEALESGSLL